MRDFKRFIAVLCSTVCMMWGFYIYPAIEPMGEQAPITFPKPEEQQSEPEIIAPETEAKEQKQGEITEQTLEDVLEEEEYLQWTRPTWPVLEEYEETLEEDEEFLVHVPENLLEDLLEDTVLNEEEATTDENAPDTWEDIVPDETPEETLEELPQEDISTPELAPEEDLTMPEGEFPPEMDTLPEELPEEVLPEVAPEETPVETPVETPTETTESESSS